MNSKDSKKITVSIPIELHKRLTELMDEETKTQSVVVTEALERHLAEKVEQPQAQEVSAPTQSTQDLESVSLDKKVNGVKLTLSNGTKISISGPVTVSQSLTS